jgi:hypothetical protein
LEIKIAAKWPEDAVAGDNQRALRKILWFVASIGNEIARTRNGGYSDQRAQVFKGSRFGN